jgi:hypothetical protein
MFALGPSFKKESHITPLEIQFRLRKRGVDQEQIAEEQGVSDMAVSRVINRKNLK